jgi:hypothetical protein
VGKDPLLCPHCHIGHLVVVGAIPRSLAPPRIESPSRAP